MKVKYTGRYPVHALGVDGKEITLYKNNVAELKELPNQGSEYCVVLDKKSNDVPEVKADEATTTKKKKVR